MKRSLLSLSAGAVLAACASYPMPIQRMADAEAAARAAQESGAISNPQAQLHLSIARDEIAQAKQLIADGDNHRADFVLVRARADAELALGEMRQQQAQAETQRVLKQIAVESARSGTLQTSTTTTTSAITTTASPAIPPTPPAPATNEEGKP